MFQHCLFCLPIFLLFLSNLILVRSTTKQVEFIENIEIEEFHTVLSQKYRNILTEFHELRNGDVNFYLMTREHRNYTKLNDSNLDLVNNTRLTKFIVGGWLQDFRVDSMFTDMANGYLDKGSYNVIIVDDHDLMFYPILVCTSYVQAIGVTVGKFIVKLNQTVNLPLQNVHIIGHSLGGNIASFAGREVKRQTGFRVYRITGLDSSRFPYSKLHKGDAEVVDLIHTTATVGLIEPSGDADFYPNGGNYHMQPGCSLYPQSPLRNLTEAVDFYLCNHHQSYEYFIKTINLTIYAVQCPSFQNFQKEECKSNELAIFGDNYKPGPNGTFYLYLNCTGTVCTSSYQ